MLSHPSKPDPVQPKPTRWRLGYKTKLYIAGLAFPTILLILAVVYLTDRSPQILFIERLRESNRSSWSLMMTLDLPFMNQPRLCILDGTNTAAGMTPTVFALYDWRMKYFGDVWSLSLGKTPVTQDDLRVIASMKHLYSLTISVSAEVTENDIELLTKLPNLNELSITVFSTTPEQWYDICARVPSLKLLRVLMRPMKDGMDRRPIFVVRGEDSLWLMRAPSSPGVNDIFDAAQGLSLPLNNQEMVDSTLFGIVAKHTSLEELRIPKAGLTNEDLKLLYGHPNLKYLILPSSIGDEELLKLQKSLPNASVRRYDGESSTLGDPGR